MGVAFLSVFCVVLLLAAWSYSVILMTGPGHAIEHVPKSAHPAPQESDAPSPRVSSDTASTSTHVGGDAAETASQSPSPLPEQKDAPPPSDADDNDVPATSTPESAPTPEPTIAPTLSPPSTAPPPPTAPTLLPSHRYCAHCEIVKPYRAHHCRACGTCVLKYDHHCPWIGQCVGARNHKFFVIFCQWSYLYWLWTFATLVGANASSPVRSIDPQQGVVIVVAGLFTLFTVLLYTIHLSLIFRNITTVEKKGNQAVYAALGRGQRFWRLRAKTATRRAWEAEWGSIGREGNLWWAGSGARAHWEEVMGEGWGGWILPIGGNPTAGLQYPTNPRFDADGRWRRRSEWPEGLR
ncbi:hypothetical protein PLICRDRAFT_39484 [Plicaturopsis crispa FD-325 SS-3]|nr:hypothetical protein PLICRDRAFT_39484 [Plicaturopsis crispa FD-325 SS-3]